MTEHPLAHANAQLSEIENLIAQVDATNDPARELVCEHLKSARSYLLGVMTAEYLSALELANHSAAKLSDRDLCRRTRRVVAELAEDHANSMAAASPQEGPPQERRHRQNSHPASSDPSNGKPDLMAWFGGSPTSFGVFYPTHFVIAMFRSMAAAEAACTAVRAGGFNAAEARAADGPEVLAFMQRIREEQGAWGELMSNISRVFDTEATFADKDVARAASGAALLAVRCESEAESEHVKRLLEPFEPLAAQWYLDGGIRSLV